MLSGSQIRAARGALGWSGKGLSEASGVSLRTIAKMESVDGIPESTVKIIVQIKNALEAAGIEFIGSPEDAPGIRMHPPNAQD